MEIFFPLFAVLMCFFFRCKTAKQPIYLSTFFISPLEPLHKIFGSQPATWSVRDKCTSIASQRRTMPWSTLVLIVLTSQPLQLPCLESLETWDMWLPPGQLEEKKPMGCGTYIRVSRVSRVCFFFLVLGINTGGGD